VSRSTVARGYQRGSIQTECRVCRKTFNLVAETPPQGTHLPLLIWLRAAWELDETFIGGPEAHGQGPGRHPGRMIATQNYWPHRSTLYIAVITRQ
jgi:hypothetical protein